jgi:hypothetical protein
MSSPMIRRSSRGSALSHSRTGSRPVVVWKKATDKIGLLIALKSQSKPKRQEAPCLAAADRLT